MIVALIALFVALGGSAAALSGSDTVQTDDLGPGSQVMAPDVAANAVNGSDVLNGSLGLADLNATSRPHKLEFDVPSNTGVTDIASFGHLDVDAECESEATALYVYLTNTTAATGTMNALITSQDASDGPVTLRTAGQFVGGHSTLTLDPVDNPADRRALAFGQFNRVEGQLVFRTPGRVTTIDFHAFAATGSGNSRCEFYGTAVTSNLS
jgi:hypothetical protein